MACSSLSRGFLDNYVCNATQAIEFKLIRDHQDLEEDTSDGGDAKSAPGFPPEYAHQFFGDSENIFGFRDLKIKLYYSAARLNRFVSMSYTEKISPEKSNGVEPDSVLETITEKIGGSFLSNLDQFSATLPDEATFQPFGELVHEFSLKSEGGGQFQVYKTSMSDPGFKEYHDRMQTFLLWFIDAASYIDVDDDRWDYFLMYQKPGCQLVSNGNFNKCRKECPIFQFIGYTTAYRYYAYPQKTRPRISQFLILPPFQRRGIGARMLQTVYDWYGSQKDVLDITVEDPSDNFIRLRDFVDAKNCCKLESYGREKLAGGWSEEMAKEVQEKLKLNKKQARRVYEILKLRATDRSNPEEYKSYRIEVKRRLNAPFVRMNRNLMVPFEETAAISTKEVRLEELKALYRAIEEEYLEIIERLALRRD